MGGDLKFLAMIYGIESATSTYSCIWCKCPKSKRWDMSQKWSLLSSEKSHLPKSNKNKFNCVHEPLFPFIPLQCVVIDTLHMFLRISDVLTNLLIQELRLLDGVNPTSCEETNIMKYGKFLNETCRIHFKWISADDHKDMKWSDLTGPEKHRLFININIPKLFPLSRGKEIQKLWDDFYSLIKTLSKNECDPDKFQKCSKEWINQSSHHCINPKM